MMNTEPLTRKHIEAIQKVVGHYKSFEMRLCDVDLTRGRMKVSDRHYVIWTKDAHKVDVTFSEDGRVSVRLHNNPDPNAPPRGTYKQ